MVIVMVMVIVIVCFRIHIINEKMCEFLIWYNSMSIMLDVNVGYIYELGCV